VIFQGPASAQEAEELSDEDIILAVENELLFDEGVSSHLIDVETSNGIVTLSGSVDNILAKERALHITESVRGVRAVVNRMIVNPISRTDEQIRMDVENALLFDSATESYEIDVMVKDGTVTLEGTVDS
jgi:osmotically-inducible protein OsmY